MLDTDREPTVVPVGGSVAPDSPAPFVEVPCTCPQGHDHDTVYLAPKLTTPMGMALATALGDEPRVFAEVEAILTVTYLAPPPSGGITGWTKTGPCVHPKPDDHADGDAEPITTENIERLLTFDTGGLEVAERANDLYAESYFRPLVRRMSRSLLLMPMDRSMPHKNGSGKKHRKRSQPSSPRASAGKP